MQKEETDLRRRTKNFALEIVRMFSTVPKTTEAQVLGKQVLRSGTSVGANYREACRARSKPEFIAKCGDSPEIGRNRLLARALCRCKHRRSRKGFGAPEGPRRTHRYFCYNSEALQGNPLILNFYFLIFSRHS